MHQDSVFVLQGRGHSNCGYCDSPAAAEANSACYARCERLLPAHYARLMNRGWRRCGRSVYVTFPTQSCCPPYTIRTNVRAFEAASTQSLSPGHLKIFKRIFKHLGMQSALPSKNISRLFECLLDAGKLRIVHQQAACDLETFSLYKKYQLSVHPQSTATQELTLDSFDSFLVQTPLFAPSPSPNEGTFHQKYFFMDNLVAVGVVDVVPHALSSVYLIYDPAFKHLCLGTFAALYELYFANVHRLEWYYMGYYIDSCVKMRYKAQFKPAFLRTSNDATFRWLPFEQCTFDAATHRLLQYKTESDAEWCTDCGSGALSAGIRHATIRFQGCSIRYLLLRSVLPAEYVRAIDDFLNLVGDDVAAESIIAI